MSSVLSIAATIATPIALFAFLGGLGYLAYHAYLSNDRKKLQSIPEADRARVYDEYLSRYNLSAEGLTRDQRFELIKSELDKRDGRATRNAKYLFLAFMCLLVFLLVAFVIFIFGNGNSRPATTPLPDTFDTKTVQFSYGLPESIFGPIDDPARRRKPLEDMDESARGRFGEDAQALWTYSEEFKEYPSGEFTSFVYIGTEAPIEIQVYLAHFTPHFTPTPLTALHGQGPKSEYRFGVKEHHKGDRLLVFMGMSKTTYDGIKSNSIRVRSQPFQPDR